MSEVWAKWEGQVINGVFPLRRLLGVSDHSGVFLSDYKSRNLPDTTIKLIPANATEAEGQLAQWRALAALAHPRLVRLIAMGRCQLEGMQFLFVVMEYAEQNLSQILGQRALTVDEVREMLPPIIDALGFLHSQHQVHGRLKPTNILAVGDLLKLATDTIRPETDGRFSASRDIWSLGTTIVEALTQQPPAGSDERFSAASIPAGLPTEFAGIVRQCLDPDPARRPTLADLKAQLAPQTHGTSVSPPSPAPPTSTPAPPTATLAPQTSTTTSTTPRPSASASPALAHATQTSAAATPVKPPPPRDASPPKTPPSEATSAISLEGHHGKRRLYLAGLAVGLIVWLAVWAAMHGRHPEQSPAVSAAPPPAAPAPQQHQEAPPAAAADPYAVLHEELPDVSSGARATIRGRIQVTVRVTIDGAGNVTETALTNSGASRYFARLATEAARKWKFAASNDQDPRKRLVIFEFSRTGVEGHAAAPRS